MRPPAPSFFRQSVTIRRQSWGRDSARGMVKADADEGQTVVCAVQEQQDREVEAMEPHDDSIVARRRFDVLIPALHPTTREPQFPAETYPDGPAIRQKDLIDWGGRTLVASIDADKAGRGGYGHVFTVVCREVV